MAEDDTVSGQELVAPSPALAPLGLRGLLIPRLIKTAGDDADRRYIEFFIARYRNEHTRRAYCVVAGYGTKHERPLWPLRSSDAGH